MKFKFTEEIYYDVEAESLEDAYDKMGDEDYSNYEVGRQMTND